MQKIIKAQFTQLRYIQHSPCTALHWYSKAVSLTRADFTLVRGGGKKNQHLWSDLHLCGQQHSSQWVCLASPPLLKSLRNGILCSTNKIRH